MNEIQGACIFFRLERCCVKDTKVKGVPIAKGIIVSYPVWYMQRDPEVWENPETFDPERYAMLCIYFEKKHTKITKIFYNIFQCNIAFYS